MYRLAPRGVISLSDQTRITRDMQEWEDYRAWIKVGNIPAPMAAAPGPTVPEVLAKIKARITSKRDGVLNGVATVNGVNFRADFQFLLILLQSVPFASANPLRIFKIKRANGNHINLTWEQVVELNLSLSERVALCCDNEAVHFEAVNSIVAGDGTDAEKIAALRNYDFSTGWPA